MKGLCDIFYFKTNSWTEKACTLEQGCQASPIVFSILYAKYTKSLYENVKDLTWVLNWSFSPSSSLAIHHLCCRLRRCSRHKWKIGLLIDFDFWSPTFIEEKVVVPFNDVFVRNFRNFGIDVDMVMIFGINSNGRVWRSTCEMADTSL